MRRPGLIVILAIIAWAALLGAGWLGVAAFQVVAAVLS